MLLNILIFMFFFVFVYFFNFIIFIVNLNIVYFSFVIFFLNYFFFKNLNINYNSNLDLLFKYLKFFTKHLFNLLNLVYVIFKKFYNFIYIKTFVFLKSLEIFFNFYLKNIFIIWRPLFKKWSYFGYYRINRSKWIK